jgi:hypothetical protein
MSDLGVGDSEIASLTVTPAGTDTQAVLTVHSPTGSSTPVPVTAGALTPGPGATQQQTWVSDNPIVYTAAGRWVLSWTVTGTGEGAEDVEVWVSPRPAPGGPTWAPGLSRVAQYIPRLTVDTQTPSADELGTFTTVTNPTDVAAQHHIDDAVAGVLAVCPTVPAGLEPLARTVAALRAAASIQRAYSNTALGMDTLSIAAALDARADTDLKRLQAAIDDLVSGDDDEPLLIAPIWTSSSTYGRW